MKLIEVNGTVMQRIGEWSYMRMDYEEFGVCWYRASPFGLDVVQDEAEETMLEKQFQAARKENAQ